ncbi:transposase [Xanthomonas translucens pv. arrhenatheri]|uniref:Transposase n=1 Tax=Xanthomonas graminis pv. arrhenatheri LMG 727 TaxID=1195923 RepID=A0A0K2ZPS1_9XANT|nr:transposase [Xanthomonas translucens pv. arrhenatheri]CTP86224.1 hypothetical protein XTALMG727_1609 [Xanthomonas translucens pv. arrhenatheri LMG 727]
MIGHLQQEHRLDRCWLNRTQGDALNAIGAAVGYYNLRWLMRWIALVRARLRTIVLPPVLARQTLHAAGNG